jgi:hypothetical protein
MIVVESGINIGGGINIGSTGATGGVVLYLNAGDNSSYAGTGTTWYDLSGYGNDVVMNNDGDISWVNAGSASYFNTGPSGFFTRNPTNGLPLGDSDYTFAAWINSPSWNYSGIMSIGGFGSGEQSNAFRTGSHPYLINYWWADDLAVITDATNTGWFYAVVKYEGAINTRSIWVNGVSQGSDNPGGTHDVTSSALQIAQTLSGEYLQGGIGQVWIYNFAVSDSDILANFDATKSIYGL